MRVLHLVTLPWQTTEGIARACRETAAALDTDIESYLVVDRDPSASAHAFAGVRIVRGWAPAIPWLPSFRAAMREFAPDVVHLHGGTIAPALAFAPALRDQPVVATCYRTAQLPRGARLQRNTLGETRGNISVTRALASSAGGLSLARRALERGRIAALCTPDPRIEATFAASGPVFRAQGAGRVSDLRAEWSETPTVVFAGRAQVARGIDDLIAAFPTVRETVPGARLLLALLPTPEAQRWVDRLANVSWAEVRAKPIVDLDATFAECQVGAFPFRWSTTLTPALAAAEAMAVGLPVVATSVECLAPLVEPGRNGALVPPNDPLALGRALADLLRGPEVWQPQSEGARKTIEERWSWTGAADVTRDAYELAIAAAEDLMKSTDVLNTPDLAPDAPAKFTGWANYFDEFAPVYERSAFGPAGLAYVGTREVDAVMETLRGVQPGRILDAGAGTGRLARRLTQAGWGVTALDVSKEMLERLAYELPTCETVHGALGTPLPFADGRFDAVVSMRVLKYVDEMQFAIDELTRVLRPGGLAMLEFANRRSLARFGYRGAPIHFVTIRGAEQMFRAAGLTPLRRVAGSRLPYPVWNAARGERAARVAATADHAVGAALGGNRTAAAARSVIIVGTRA